MTGRPSPSGREERSLRTQKDDDTVESTMVFGNSFSFAGEREKEDLDQRDKPSTGCSQKELRGKARRRTLQVFRGNGLATHGARQGKEEGSSLQTCTSPSLHSVDPDGIPWPASLAIVRFAPSIDSVRLAANGPPLRRRTFANAGEPKPREGFTSPMRVRITALEGVPVR